VTAVRALATTGELARAESTFRRVFAKANYTDPFSDNLSARLLLYPIDYTIFDRRQYEAVAMAAHRAGSDRAYFAGYGGEDQGWGGTYGHGVVDLCSYDDYRGANASGALEHFLFGLEGDWGAVTSDGEYALLGGTPSFAAAVIEALGYEQERVVRAFVSDWRAAGKAGASVAWVPSVLDHVLGAGEGSRAWDSNP
jgi:hypothetical protein